MMENQIIHETATLEEAILTEKMVLSNVKICGLMSENKRIYPIEVLNEAKHLYENFPVYLDHDFTARNRKYHERIGHFSNVHVKEKGMYGNLNINPHHTLAESIWWDFNHNTVNLGISHVVIAEMGKDNTVKKINKLSSLDICNNPATTHTLKEEIDEVEQLKVDVKKLSEELAEMRLKNNGLVSEISEIKKVATAKKPVAIAASGAEPELPIQD